MKVKYTEGPDALTVPTGAIAERGKTIEVPDDVGVGLIAQGWKAVGGTSTHSKAVLKAASDFGINIDEVEGTGANGNVTVKDVKAAGKVQAAIAEAADNMSKASADGETATDDNQGDDGATTEAVDDAASEEQK